MERILIFAFLLTVASALRFEEERLWKSWKQEHGKQYSEVEERGRKAVWFQNLKKVEQHNRAGHSYTLAMNEFADMCEEEFRNVYLRYRFNASSPQRGATFMAPNNLELPTKVDWRQQGYVTPVKNQGQCGSCWAFSTTGSLEGQHFRKTGSLVSLSEQQLVDCDTTCYGCQGGFVDNAIAYVQRNGGIDTEYSYPYEGSQNYCRYNQNEIGATATGYVDIPRGNEYALQQATATIGPISIAVDASHFQLYNGGVFDYPYCSSTQLDHAILVVGYGNNNGQDYWLVKNSWGTGWGMSGYILMSRNKDNQCGIASSASYPLV
ncbi:procathepsin L-like [Nematostella vectensis]|uniref:procathepsin L-like n=1 Tax=Nematostella vectensis TaxID=45351 RepID=UPI00207758DA|nr:procathepsin L-like [Nematostella vectensis]